MTSQIDEDVKKSKNRTSIGPSAVHEHDKNRVLITINTVLSQRSQFSLNKFLNTGFPQASSGNMPELANLKSPEYGI